MKATSDVAVNNSTSIVHRYGRVTKHHDDRVY